MDSNSIINMKREAFRWKLKKAANEKLYKMRRDI
jgi:hypothetical protein